MGALPQLRVVAAVRDAVALERMLSHGFGITRVLRHQEETLEARLFGFNNGDLLVLSPRAVNDAFALLPAQSRGAFIAVGAVSEQPMPNPDRMPKATVGRIAPLSKMRLSTAGASGLSVLVGSDPSFSAIDPASPYALDHIAAVVRNRTDAADDLQSSLGAPRWVEGWDFPEFAATNTCLRFDHAYFELNQPWGADGFFGDALAESGPGFMFVCLRSADPDASLERLHELGYPVQASRAVHACAPGSTHAIEIGRAHSFSRRQTSGLRLTLFDTWWPWQLADDHRGQRIGAALENH